MRRRWTNEHGKDGLRDKFSVYKTKDRGGIAMSHTYTASARLGADGEFVFVLRPETDLAARMALTAYAEMVRWRAPVLADDIQRELSRIDQENEQ